MAELEIEAVGVKSPAVIDTAVDDLDGLSIQEITAKVLERRNAKAAAIEAAKTHPLTDFSLGDKQWQILKSNILDGGGVTDDRDLSRSLLQAMMHDDQPTFWQNIIGLVKSRAKITGNLRQLPNGGVSLSGIAPGGGGGVIRGIGPG